MPGKVKIKVKVKPNLHSVFNQNVLIVWKPRYNLGIPIIDEHHRGIVTTINSLYFGMQNKHGEDMLRPAVRMIHDYTLMHFAVEEAFLRKYMYPGLKQHQQWHKELKIELARIGKKSIGDHDPYEFLLFLKDWWIDHICKKDREFLKYLLSTLKNQK